MKLVITAAFQLLLAVANRPNRQDNKQRWKDPHECLCSHTKRLAGAVLCQRASWELESEPRLEGEDILNYRWWREERCNGGGEPG